MDISIAARPEQSKCEEDGVAEESNTPISNWTKILVTGESKSNAVQGRQTLAWLDLATYVPIALTRYRKKREASYKWSKNH